MVIISQSTKNVNTIIKFARYYLIIIILSYIYRKILSQQAIKY